MYKENFHYLPSVLCFVLILNCDLVGVDDPVSQSLYIRAIIPHFFGDNSVEAVEIGEGFGSRQPAARLQRSIAFYQCISGLLNLRQSSKDLSLRMLDGGLISTPCKRIDFGFRSIQLEIFVATVENCVLQEAIDLLASSINVLNFNLDDPRKLGLVARDWLIAHPSPADLNIYLEDDLVIRDPLFPEKIVWIAEKSNQQCVLLPHRYELIPNAKLPVRLYIDGPSNHEEISDWHQPSPNFASGLFRGAESVTFDVPSNPHSGFFAVTKHQLEILAAGMLPCSGFVGPLETAATYTVGSRFTLLKAALDCRDFFLVEHAHPSYLGYLSSHRHS